MLQKWTVNFLLTTDRNGKTEWYWRDDTCEEDIGPFDNLESAVLDYAAYGAPKNDSKDKK